MPPLCISLLTWWFLMIPGPTPLVLGRYQTEEACQVARYGLARSFTLDGRQLGAEPMTRSQGTSTP